MLPTELLRHFVAVLDRLDIPYFVTGSFALAPYGAARMTMDIDVVVELPLNAVKPLCEAFPDPEYYVSTEAAIGAATRSGMFNIIHIPTSFKIDVIVSPDTPFNRSRFVRSRRIPLESGGEIVFSSAEDLILNKMLFYKEGESTRHLRDITGIIESGRVPLDMEYIAGWALRLGVHTVWRDILIELGRESEYPFREA